MVLWLMSGCELCCRTCSVCIAATQSNLGLFHLLFVFPLLASLVESIPPAPHKEYTGRPFLPESINLLLAGHTKGELAVQILLNQVLYSCQSIFNNIHSEHFGTLTSGSLWLDYNSKFCYFYVASLPSSSTHS